jgi:hypothetical protein
MKALSNAYDMLTKYARRTWKIDGRQAEPTRDDVNRLIEAMVKDIREQGYDSIESGGILVKRDGDWIDIYVHAGAYSETDNSI